MSAPLDVLAVMGTQAGMARTEGRVDCAAELEAARAAVAELVEAARSLSGCYTESAKAPVLVALRAALAKFGGAA